MIPGTFQFMEALEKARLNLFFSRLEKIKKEPKPAKKLRPSWETGRKIELRLTHLMATGFWFCLDCERVTERCEGENGQPHYCLHCKGHNLRQQRPTL